MPRGYKRIPSDIVEKWRRMRADGAPLRHIYSNPLYPTTFQYASKICVGKARRKDGGPITPPPRRLLTADERAIVQAEVRKGLRIYGRPPGDDAVSKIIGAHPSAVVKEKARFTAWIERLLSYVAKAGPDDCWIWTGGVSRYQSRKGIVIERPRFMTGGDRIQAICPTRWLFDYWAARPGKPLLDSERLKQTCGHLLCVNPRHQKVVTVKRKVHNATAAL